MKSIVETSFDEFVSTQYSKRRKASICLCWREEYFQLFDTSKTFYYHLRKCSRRHYQWRRSTTAAIKQELMAQSFIPNGHIRVKLPRCDKGQRHTWKDPSTSAQPGAGSAQVALSPSLPASSDHPLLEESFSLSTGAQESELQSSPASSPPTIFQEPSEEPAFHELPALDNIEQAPEPYDDLSDSSSSLMMSLYPTTPLEPQEYIDPIPFLSDEEPAFIEDEPQEGSLSGLLGLNKCEANEGYP